MSAHSLARLRRRARMIVPFALAAAVVLAAAASRRSVTALPGPALTIAPVSGPAGSTMTLTGSGLPVGQQAQVFWNGAPLTLPPTVTGRGGSFRVDVAAPAVPAGSYSVTVTVAGQSAAASFTVTAGAPTATATIMAEGGGSTGSIPVRRGAPVPTPSVPASPTPTTAPPTPSPAPTQPAARRIIFATPTATAPATVRPTGTTTAAPLPTVRATATATPPPAATPSPVTSSGSKYPLHRGITATVFWIGEPADADNDYITNTISAWDDAWQAHYGGVDDPFRRNGSFPVGFTPRENPFYFDLPYNDFSDAGGRRKNAASVVYWAGEKQWDRNESMLKNRWIKVMKGGNVCYGQWEDAGPFLYDDAAYVFGAAAPRNTEANSAGMDVSPALRDCLGFNGLNNADNKVDWQFVDAQDVPAGPWMQIVTTSGTYWP